jgi:predicted metalloendopeptidase
MDTAHRDQLEAAPLNPDFTIVDHLTAPEDVLRYLGNMQRGDLTGPVKIEVRSDPRNPTDNIAVASQGQLTLGAPDYQRGPEIRPRAHVLPRIRGSDVHSRGHLDDIANNLDEFYTTWDIKPSDPAYLPPDQRIHLWSSTPN